MPSAEQIWFSRLDRAQGDMPAERAKLGLSLWHRLMCIEADYEGCGFIPSDAGHQERERLRVLSELGELHGIGPLPTPGQPRRRRQGRGPPPTQGD
jgi:hypothetical protein